MYDFCVIPQLMGFNGFPCLMGFLKPNIYHILHAITKKEVRCNCC